MTDYHIGYATNYYGGGTDVHSSIIVGGVLDLSGFNLFGSDVTDANAFFDTFNTGSNSFSYAGGNLTLRFGEGADAHTVTIYGFTAAADAGFRIKTETGTGAANFLVSQLALSLAPQSVTAIGDSGVTLDGGSGGDYLTGGAGADTIDGHLGFDYAYYSASAGGITFDVTAAADTDGFREVTVADGENDRLRSIEGIIGSAHADTFTVGANDGISNIFYGGAGDDRFTVKFASNSNEYFGDTIDAGLGLDTLSLGGANNAGALVVNLFGELSITVAGVTTSQALTGFENLDLRVGNYVSDQVLTFYGNNFDNVVSFSNEALGVVSLHGYGGFDTLDLSALTAEIEINQYSQAQTIEGWGAGFSALAANEIRSYNFAGGDIDSGNVISGFEKIIGGSSRDTIFNGILHGQIDGGADEDFLYASFGNNIVNGGAGDDTIVVGKGWDIVDGGAGVDTIDYSLELGFYDAVILDLKDADEGEGDLAGVAYATRVYYPNDLDTIKNIERIEGSGGGDTLSGNSAANSLFGNGGDDKLYGEAGADFIRGGDGDDLVDGGTGDYTLNSDGEIVYQATTSGHADHTYEYASVVGEKAVRGNLGDDIVKFSGRSDGNKADDIQGNEGYDTLDLSDAIAFRIKNDAVDHGFYIGIGDNNVVRGWNGKDFTNSNQLAKLGDFSGFEKIVGSAYADYIKVSYTSSADVLDHVLEGGVGDDTIIDSAGDSVLRGGAGNDKLYGNQGDDELYGGAGNDRLSGLIGSDKLYGGAGADTYVLNIRTGGLSGKSLILIDDYDTGRHDADNIVATISTIVFSDSYSDQYFAGVAALAADASDDAKVQAILAEVNYNFAKSGNDLQIIYREDSLKSITTTIKDFFFSDNYLNFKFTALTNFDGTTAEISSLAFKNLNVAKTGDAGTIAATETGAQSLLGSLTDDELTGRDNAGVVDTIFGLSGDDFITGAAGADIIDGGADFDTVNYHEALAEGAANVNGVTYDFTNAASDYVGVGGDAAGDKLSNIEAIIGTDAVGGPPVAIMGMDQFLNVIVVGYVEGNADRITFSAGSGNSNGNDIARVDAKGGDDRVEIDLAGDIRSGIVVDGGAGSDTLVLTGIAGDEFQYLVVDLAAGTLVFNKASDPATYHTINIAGFENVELIDAVHFGKWWVIGDEGDNIVTLRGENSRTEGSGTGVLAAPTSLAELDGTILLGGGNDQLVLDATRLNSNGDRVNAPTNYNLNIEGGAGTDTVTFANTHIGPSYGVSGSRSGNSAITTVNLGNYGLQQGFSNRFAIDNIDDGVLISGSSARFVGIENLEAGKESDYTFIGDYYVANRFTSLEDKEFTVGGGGTAVEDIRGTHTFISYGGYGDTFDIPETLPHARSANANVELFSASTNDRIANEEFVSDTMNKVSWSFEFASRGVTIDLNEIHTGRATRFVMDKITGSNHADTITVGAHLVVLVEGGGGNDVLTGGGNTKVLRGGAGHDRLISNLIFARDDYGFMYGEAGDDVFEPTRISGRYGLKLDGGPGTDTLDFTHDNLKYDTGDSIYLYAEGIGNIRSTAKTGFGVDVTIGGTANAYKVGTSVTSLELVKSMTSVENAIGTNVDDILTGDGVDNRLEGRGGDDILSGGGGADIIYGGAGDDILKGGDSLTGTDTNIGGKGHYIRPYLSTSYLDIYDRIPNAAKNILQGGAGADTYEISANSVNEISDYDAGTVVDFTAVGTIGLGGNGANQLLLSRFLQSDVASSFTSVQSGYDLIIIMTRTTESGGDTASDTKTSTFSSYLVTDEAYQTITTIKNFYYPGVADLYTFKFKGSNDERLGNEAPVDVEITGRQFIDATYGNTIDISDADATTNTGLQIVGSNSNDIIIDNDGDNTIHGLAGYDQITGNGGHDIVYGGEGYDHVLGGAGNDKIYGYADTGDSAVVAESTYGSTDYLLGGDGDDTIYGNKGNDYLYGEAGADSIYGGDGNDYIEGGTGNDARLDGGAGNDRIYGSTETTTPTFLTTTTKILGGAGDDYIVAAVAGGFVVRTNSGTTDEAKSGYIYGGAGNDRIFGSAFKDSIFGDEGDDIIETGDGGDEAVGGDGNDKITGGAGVDYLFGRSGDDTIYGMGGDDIIEGHEGQDRLYGGEGADSISGDSGSQGLRTDDDYIEGGAGADTIHGGAGDDTIYGGIGVDTIYGEHSNGQISSSRSGDDYIDGGADNDIIDGQHGDDTITGGAGNDFMQGGSGDDTFLALGGANSGVDYIDGGGGTRDVVDFSAAGAGIKVDLSTVADINGVAKGAGTEDVAGVATMTVNDGASTATIVGYLKDVEHIYGTIYDDEITGDASDNLILGGVGYGSDILAGGGGNDRLEGGYGFDTYKVAAGGETTILDVDYGAYSIRTTIDLTGLNALVLDASTIAEFVSTDAVVISRSGAYDLSITITTGDDVTTLLVVENFYYAPYSFDFMFNVKVGSAAEEVLAASGGDFIFGDAPTQNLYYSTTPGELVLQGSALQNDLIIGRNNADFTDVIIGNGGDDTLYGYAGDDILTGGKGGDRLIGGAGEDTLDGGAGVDSAEYSASGEGVTMTLAKVVGALFTGVYGGDALGDKISSIERIVGSGYDDSITVAFDTNAAIKYEVVAGYGADSLTVDFGTAADAAAVVLDIDFDGGFGVDTLILAGKLNLANAADGLAIDLGADAIQLGAVSLTGVENIDLTGFTSNANVVGFTGSDVANIITLGDLKKVDIETLAGDDIVKIGDAVKGITGLDGGLGTDLLDFSSRTNGVTLNLATGTLAGKEATSTLVGAAGSISGFESVMGSEEADDITGSRYNDVLLGGDGNDILKGGAGTDFIDGGSGIDTVSYRGETVGVYIALAGAGYATFSRADGSDYDYILNVERIHGSLSDDVLVGDSADNELIGYAGNDIIYGGGGVDDLRGVAGDDTIYGNAGNDNIRGDDGADTIYGGAGDDTITGGTGADTIYGGAGDDTIAGGTGDDTIYTDAGIETITAGDDKDKIIFAASSSYIHEGDTAATFDVDAVDGGGGGNDLADFYGTYAYFTKDNVNYGIKVDLSDADGTDTASVKLNKETDADEVATLDNIEHISGTFLADTIAGSSVANTIYGNEGNDILNGLGGDDEIYGGAGDDEIRGGDGSDIIYGGAGNDILVWLVLLPTIRRILSMVARATTSSMAEHLCL